LAALELGFRLGLGPNPVGSGPGGTQLNCQRSQGECDAPGTDVIDCSFNGNHFTSIDGFFGELDHQSTFI
jgi:hypothetical protein